jgi:hypothetical protein
MTYLTEEKWTIVQHSGFGYAGKEGFKQATETRKISTAGELKIVKRAGGVLFSTYREAEEFSEKANYPDGYNSLYPAVKGTFSSKKVDGLAIYVPFKVAVG